MAAAAVTVAVVRPDLVAAGALVVAAGCHDLAAAGALDSCPRAPHLVVLDSSQAGVVLEQLVPIQNR